MTIWYRPLTGFRLVASLIPLSVQLAVVLPPDMRFCCKRILATLRPCQARLTRLFVLSSHWGVGGLPVPNN